MFTAKKITEKDFKEALKRKDIEEFWEPGSVAITGPNVIYFHDNENIYLEIQAEYKQLYHIGRRFYKADLGNGLWLYIEIDNGLITTLFEDDEE